VIFERLGFHIIPPPLLSSITPQHKAHKPIVPITPILQSNVTLIRSLPPALGIIPDVQLTTLGDITHEHAASMKGVEALAVLEAVPASDFSAAVWVEVEVGVDVGLLGLFRGGGREGRGGCGRAGSRGAEGCGAEGCVYCELFRWWLGRGTNGCVYSELFVWRDGLRRGAGGVLGWNNHLDFGAGDVSRVSLFDCEWRGWRRRDVEGMDCVFRIFCYRRVDRKQPVPVRVVVRVVIGVQQVQRVVEFVSEP
jgi:hypothetical protein